MPALNVIKPPVDIIEEVDKFTVIVDLPGVEPEDVEIKGYDNYIQITGIKRPVCGGNYLLMERFSGKFNRKIYLRMLQQFEDEQLEIPIPEELPLLPVRDLVIFPYMVFPIFVGRSFSIKAIEEAIENYDRYIFLSLQKDKDIEEPGGDDLYQIGTVATILRMMRLDDDRIKILVQGVSRGKIEELRKEADLYKVKISVFEEKESYGENIEVEALKHSIRDLIDKAVGLGKQIIPDLLDIIKSVEEPGSASERGWTS